MRYTIEGFSQEYAMTLKKTVVTSKGEKTIKIDCTDLVVLRWFTDFYPNMRKTTIDGREYVMVAHRKLLEDLPMIDISKQAFIDRMQKLVEFGILDYQLVKKGGTFSFYAFGENYIHLVDDGRSNAQGVCAQTHTGYAVKHDTGMRSNAYGVCGQTHNENSSIEYSSIEDSSIDNNIVENTEKHDMKTITEIVDYLNEKAHKKYRSNNKTTIRHINARLKEGYTLSDFKQVIDNRCATWLGTDMEQYLRPETLFGSKFENYLNARAPKLRGGDGRILSDETNGWEAAFDWMSGGDKNV